MKKKAAKKSASKSTKKVVKKKSVDQTSKREQLKAKAKAKAKLPIPKPKQSPELLDELKKVEKRLTDVARAFYGSGKASALREAFNGWKEDIEPARIAIARVESKSSEQREETKENLAIVAGWYIVYLKPFKPGYSSVGPLMRYIDASGMSYLSNPKQLKTHVFMITRGKVEQYQEMKLVLAEEHE